LGCFQGRGTAAEASVLDNGMYAWYYGGGLFLLRSVCWNRPRIL